MVATYTTLGVMPTVWNYINNSLGGKGVVVLFVLYIVTGISVLFYILFIKKERRIGRYLLFSLFICIFLVMYKLEKNPGEKIHMAQYGLFGVFLFNALKVDLDKFGKKFYLYGFIICLVVGALDEVIQGFLPNRVFTWHDTFINGASGIITLLIIRFNILQEDIKIEKGEAGPLS